MMDAAWNGRQPAAGEEEVAACRRQQRRVFCCCRRTRGWRPRPRWPLAAPCARRRARSHPGCEGCFSHALFNRGSAQPAVAAGWRRKRATSLCCSAAACTRRLPQQPGAAFFVAPRAPAGRTGCRTADNGKVAGSSNLHRVLSSPVARTAACCLLRKDCSR